MLDKISKVCYNDVKLVIIGSKMMKRLFLLFILSTIGVVHAPGVLVANGVEKIADPEFNAVETVIEPEVMDEPTEVALPLTPSAGVASTVVSYTAPAVSDNVTFGGTVIPLVQTYSEDFVSDSAANWMSWSYIYGHNSGNIFGILHSAYVGQTFSVTFGGVTKNYVVSRIVDYENNYNPALGKYRLQLDGQGDYNEAVKNGINKKSYAMNGESPQEYHSISLLTCYGTMLGGGNATHRRVVFGDEI